VNVVALLASLALIVAAIVFLARRRWFIGTEFLAASLVIGLWTGPTFDALLIWLALAGLSFLLVVLFRVLRASGKS
jgi:hypothetical protein